MKKKSTQTDRALMICGLLLLPSVMAQAKDWEPNAHDRNAAIQAANLSPYFAKLTAWLDQQVPSDPAQITKPRMKALLADPKFMSALAERHFLAKVWGPGAWDANQLVHNEQGDNYSFSKGVRNLDLFAKAEPSNKEFLSWLTSSGRLMDETLLTVTPSSMYGRRDDSQALTITTLETWKKIYDADPASRKGLYLRLAVASVLRPPGSANQGAGKAGEQSSIFDRYMHYRNAHMNGELMPSFDTLTPWEMTHVVSSGVSNDDLAWGREALNTWNPNFRKNENVVSMVSQVWRRGANGVPYNDMSLVMGAGGKCGPRSSFGVFINQAFGIPSTGVGQPAHAAIAHRDVNGNWQVSYGKGWHVSKVFDRYKMSGPEFLEMVKERKTGRFADIEHLRWIASLIESPGTEPYLIPAHQQYQNPRATAVYSHWDTLPDAYGKIEGVPFSRTADEKAALSLFEAPANAGEMYFARVRGFIHPVASGDYVFSITSDDHSDLFLSTDDDPANRQFIAAVEGWSAPEDFSRKSRPIRLEAGRKYYIEAVHRELDMGDHLRVAWAGPGVEEGVIAGANLSPYPKGARGSIEREVWWDKNNPAPEPTEAIAASETKPEAPIKPPRGGIHVEAEDFFAHSEVEVMDCYTGGKQVFYPPQRANSFCGYKINVPETGVYEFSARVATVNWGQQIYVRSFGAMYPVAEAKASNVYRNEQGLGPQQAIDQDLTTRWAMDFGKEDGWLELNLGRPREISKLIVDERALNYICRHRIEYKVGDAWKTLMEGEYMKNYVKSFDPVTAQYVRLRTFECRAPTGGPTVRDFSVGSVLDGCGYIEIPWTPALEKNEKGGMSGRWQSTKPMEMYLVKGEQTIWVCTQTLEAQRSVAMRWFQLTPKG